MDENGSNGRNPRTESFSRLRYIKSKLINGFSEENVIAAGTTLNLTSGALIFLLLTPFLSAQSLDPRKFEVGAGYSLFRTRFLGADSNESGIATSGLQVFRLSCRRSGIEPVPTDLVVFSKGMTEGLFGPKAGWRSERVGMFGPGFIHFHERREPFPCPRVIPPPLVCVLGGRTEFALDAGGVLEFYPHPHITLRFDVGDTMIRFRVPVQRFGQPGPDRVVPSTIVDGFWSHNFQFGTSVGFRF